MALKMNKPKPKPKSKLPIECLCIKECYFDNKRYKEGDTLILSQKSSVPKHFQAVVQENMPVEKVETQEEVQEEVQEESKEEEEEEGEAQTEKRYEGQAEVNTISAIHNENDKLEKDLYDKSAGKKKGKKKGNK